MALQEEDVQISIVEDESKHYHSNVELNGILTLLPRKEKMGIVVFAHGSGSGRQSPRNQYVASVLNNSGIGTLLVDLLTADEQKIDDRTREFRFNIRLLTNRLSAVTDWLLTKYHEVRNAIPSIGYFGASTGAAAALIAAAERSAASDDVVGSPPSATGAASLTKYCF
jgi:putative phosphoribosyl transferase